MPVQRMDCKSSAMVGRTEKIRMACPRLLGRAGSHPQLRIAFEHRCLNTEPKFRDQEARRVGLDSNVELMTKWPRILLRKLDDEIIEPGISFLESRSLSARIDRILPGLDVPRTNGLTLRRTCGPLGFEIPTDFDP